MTEPRVAQLLAAAAAAQQAGRPDAAVPHLEAVLKVDPHHPQALNSLGVRALDSGDPGRAAALFARATAADPKEPALWLNLAKAQRALEDDEGERASLNQALAADQRNFMARVRMAELHERLGESALANYNWSAVLQLSRGITTRSPLLDDILARAKAYVEQQAEQFAAAIAADLDPIRAGLDGSERRRFEAAIDTSLGRRRIYTNQCAGLHFPFLPADEFYPRDHFPWMPALEARTDAIRAELEALLQSGEQGFTPYVKLDPGTPANIWSDLDRSARWSAFYLWEYGIRFDEACARCPETAAAVEAVPQADIPNRAPTAFFSLLRPGARIPPHTGVTNVRTTVHLPLIVPPGCGFRVGGETREWKVGEAFAFDDTIEHEAWNNSAELRAVLIIDVWNPHLTEAERQLLRTYFASADASGLNPHRTAGAR